MTSFLSIKARKDGLKEGDLLMIMGQGRRIRGLGPVFPEKIAGRDHLHL